MRLYIIPIFLFFLTVNVTSAQTKWGIEFKGSRFNNSNTGELTGSGNGAGYIYDIDNEIDLVTYSQSLGVIYKLNEQSSLKFHIGNHQTGRILSYTVCDSAPSCTAFTNVNEIFHYVQLAPSYSYRILNKTFSFPVEAGINININTGESDPNIIPLNKFNFDYELSAGVDYRLDPELFIGVHALYTANINEYQDKETVTGSYKPKEFGFEFSILYEFLKNANER